MYMLKRVGIIGNYYGGLHVMEKDGKFYWFINDWDTDLDNVKPEECQEIPEHLYNTLVKFEESENDE